MLFLIAPTSLFVMESRLQLQEVKAAEAEATKQELEQRANTVPALTLDAKIDFPGVVRIPIVATTRHLQYFTRQPNFGRVVRRRRPTIGMTLKLFLDAKLEFVPR
jgi:hypothetical protein